MFTADTSAPPLTLVSRRKDPRPYSSFLVHSLLFSIFTLFLDQKKPKTKAHEKIDTRKISKLTSFFTPKKEEKK